MVDWEKVESRRGKLQRRFQPLKAVRYKCLDCSGGSWKEVRNCEITECPIWDFRFGKNPKVKQCTSMKAIRRKCLDCCCGSSYEVKYCENKDCSLWEFRFGKNPDTGIAKQLIEENIPVWGKKKIITLRFWAHVGSVYVF
jgi:hypothetical protein